MLPNATHSTSMSALPINPAWLNPSYPGRRHRRESELAEPARKRPHNGPAYRHEVGPGPKPDQIIWIAYRTSGSHRSAPRVSTSLQRPTTRSWPLPATLSGRSPGSRGTQLDWQPSSQQFVLSRTRVLPTTNQKSPAPLPDDPRPAILLCARISVAHGTRGTPTPTTNCIVGPRTRTKGWPDNSISRVDGRGTATPRPVGTPPSGSIVIPDQCRKRPRRLKLQSCMTVCIPSSSRQPALFSGGLRLCGVLSQPAPQPTLQVRSSMHQTGGSGRVVRRPEGPM